MAAKIFPEGFDLPVDAPGAPNFSRAKIPTFSVLDLSGDWQPSRNIRLLGGGSNILERKYSNRVFQNGIEPGTRRTV
jgi:Fe(3+) dicitrate transport protein